MKKQLLLLSICLGFFLELGCSKSTSHKINSRPKAVNAVKTRFIKEAEKKYDLFIQGIGGGGVEGVTHQIYYFRTKDYQPPEKMESMLIELVEIATKMINEDEAIRPYLVEYPFSHSRFNISISYPVEIQKEMDPSYPNSFDYQKGYIYQNHIDYSKNFVPMITLKKEKYPPEEK